MPFRIRTVTQEYEAQLTPTGSGIGSHARGQSEWKRYKDDTRKFKVSVSGLEVPDGTVLDIALDGWKIGEMTIQRGISRLCRETEKGTYAPPVGADQELQILLGGKLILQGKFYEE
jgi:hypothetical protein